MAVSTPKIHVRYTASPATDIPELRNPPSSPSLPEGHALRLHFAESRTLPLSQSPSAQAMNVTVDQITDDAVASTEYNPSTEPNESGSSSSRLPDDTVSVNPNTRFYLPEWVSAAYDNAQNAKRALGGCRPIVTSCVGA